MKSFCIIGLGKFGTALAQTLAAEGKQVMVIDIDADKVNAIADVVTHAVIGDPTNEAVLRSCGASDYDCAVVCMARNINDNILLCIMLKEMGIKKVVGRAINEGHERVLKRIGADVIVFPEKDMGEKIGYLLSRDNVTEFIEFHGYQIVEVCAPEGWIGKNLIDLALRKKYNVNIVAITDADGDVNVSPLPTRTFSWGDRVSVIGKEKDIEKLTKQVG
jgi:trk system potassium uptake protein TrkA